MATTNGTNPFSSSSTFSSALYIFRHQNEIVLRLIHFIPLQKGPFPSASVFSIHAAYNATIKLQ